ncbi:MAG: hypothetical protein HY231_09970 [Acidobacteria bacterium]|nr:hypothetical protein [Acidobacteriota bacterium]
MTLKLLSYNIRFGGSGREERIAQVINAIAPDLVIFQEAISPKVIEGLALKTAMPFWAARRNHSVGFISRLKITHYQWHAPRGAKHPLLELHLEEQRTRIFGLHLRAMLSKWSERRRVEEIKGMLESIKNFQQGFHVVVGDFNSLAPGEWLNTEKLPAWIRAMVWLSGRDIQRETIKTMLDMNYLDGFRALHPDEKGYTFPAWEPHIRFDYLFIPTAFSDRLQSCTVVNNLQELAQASDHLPLLTQLKV